MGEETINFELLKYWMKKVSSKLDDLEFEKDEENYHLKEHLGLLVEDVFRWYI